MFGMYKMPETSVNTENIHDRHAHLHSDIFLDEFLRPSLALSRRRGETWPARKDLRETRLAVMTT